MLSRILIIEDEEAIAEIEKDYLELSDFEVFKFEWLNLNSREFSQITILAIT